MALNAQHLSTERRISGLGRRVMGGGLLWILASVGVAVADPAPSTSTDVTTPGAMGAPVTSSNSNAGPSAAEAAAAADAAPAQAIDLSPAQNPNPRQVTPNEQVPNTPLLPQQAGNAYTPFSSTSAMSTAQSPQITTPSLYTTGIHDVSQIATNTGLRQAFTDQPSTSGFLSSEQEGGYSHPPIERIRLGPFDLKAAVLTSMVYDDNLRINNNNGTTSSSGGSRSDTSYTVTPAVLLEYGAHEGQRGYASVVYSPTFERFFHHSDQNTDNYQNVAFNAQYPFQRLTLNFATSYAQTAGVNSDLNQRTVQTYSLTTLGASYLIDDKLTLTCQAQYLKTEFSTPQDTQTPGQTAGEGGETSSLNNSIAYRLSDKLTVGPNFNVGIDKPEKSPQQTYEQGTIGVTYQPTEKISAFIQGGLEFRQYDGGSDQGVPVQSSDKTNPIFSAGIGYAPFDATTLSLNAQQAIHSSDADSNQTVVDTGVTVSVTQRFFQRLFLNGTFNYSHSEDQANGGNGVSAIASQNQDVLTYRASLSIAPTAWSSATVYYQYLDNQSNQPGQTYYDNQVGIALSAQF